MKQLLFLFFISTGTLSFAQYGGKVDLRITFEGRPVVGYTITGSINKVDIGGKGVTDRYGEVTLNTDKLPTPQIDLKGTRSCGSNGNASFEVSGIVYISSGNYHLELDKVVCMMSNEFGIEASTLVTAYGISCSGSLGRVEDNRSSSKPYQTSGYRTSCESFLGETSATSNEEQEPTSIQTSPINSENNASSESEEEFGSKVAADKARWEEESKQREEQRKLAQEQRKADFKSGKTTAENYQNAREMHQNKISRLDSKIQAQKELLAMEKNPKKSNELKYDIQLNEIERSIQALKLEKVEKEIAAGNVPLTKPERQLYKAKIDQFKSEEKELKERKKAKEPFDNSSIVVESSDGKTEDTELQSNNDEADLYNADEIANMSTLELKKLRLKTNATISKRKATLKMKGSLLKVDKKEALEKELESLKKLVVELDKEIERRKKEKDK